MSVTQEPKRKLGRRYDEADFQLAREFGARVRACRLAAGFKTPRELARAMGISDENRNFNSTLGGIEHGDFFPKPLRTLQIARALGVSVSYLYGDDSGDGDYHAGYRAALADVEHAMHDNLKELRQRGRKS